MMMSNTNEGSISDMERLEILAAQTGPETMVLDLGEVIRAMGIKQAVEARQQQQQQQQQSTATDTDTPPPLQPLSDYEYVQYAIACDQDETMDGILERIEMMQAFKEEYKIQDTLEEGIEILNLMTKHHPGFLLSVEYLAYQHNYIAVFDRKALIPSRMKQTTEDYRIILGGFYYLFQSMLCNFMAIRVGVSIMSETMGATRENYDHSLFYDKLIHELWRWYPFQTREIFCLNPPTWLHIVVASIKKIMQPNFWKSLQLGHQITGMEGRPIDGLYKMPTEEAARQRVVLAVHAFLALRRHNAEHFVLPSLGELDLP